MNDKLMVLEQVREVIRLQKLSKKTEQAYLDWTYRFIIFHHQIRPQDMDEREFAGFLTFLETEKKFSTSTQNQALYALYFFYKHILKKDPGRFNLKRTAVKKAWPVILTHREIEQILDHLKGESKLIISLLYGSGLRLSEGLKLRVRDIDFKTNKITVRDDEVTLRATLLPKKIRMPLKDLIEKIRLKLNESSIGRAFPGVWLPRQIEEEHPDASKELEWQYLFPARNFVVEHISGQMKQRYHQESFLQDALQKAVGKAHLRQHITCRTFRHSFATHLLEAGYDIRTVQELLGHKNVRSTRIYLHLAGKNRLHVQSPLDR